MPPKLPALDNRTMKTTVITLPTSAFRYVENTNCLYASHETLCNRYSHIQASLPTELIVYNHATGRCKYFEFEKHVKMPNAYTQYKSDDGMSMKIFHNSNL